MKVYGVFLCLSGVWSLTSLWKTYDLAIAEEGRVKDALVRMPNGFYPAVKSNMLDVLEEGR